MSRVRRYQNPDIYEPLAAEYVLGTLHGKALKRFERLKHERPYIQYAVDIWERRLNELGQTIPESRPPEHIWRQIKDEVESQQATGQDEKKWGLLSGLWDRLPFWQAATFALSLGLVLAVLPKPDHDMVAPNWVSVLQSDAEQPMMVALGDRDKGMLVVRVVDMPTLAGDQDLELWAIPKDGSAPVSVGMVREDSMETQIKLTKTEWKKLSDVERFAISFEPAGGSSTGSPSGPIMYQGQCLDFI